MPELGIVCALPREAKALTGGSGPAPGRLAVSGIGAERAARAAAALVAQGARGLVSFGLCAGLEPALGAGRVVVAARVLTADGTALPCDPHWRAALLAALDAPPWPEPTIAHAPRVLATPPEKARLRGDTGASVADMESAAIAGVAAAAGLPLVALRVVFDDAGTALPAALLGALDEHGRLRLNRLPTLARPDVLAHLPRLARASRAAGRGLEQAAAALRRSVPGPAGGVAGTEGRGL